MIKTSKEYQAAVVGSPRRTELFLVVVIEDPDLVYMDTRADSEAPWTKAETIHDKVVDPPPRYATLERNRWLLDESFDLYPDDFEVPELENQGFANNRLCGPDGVFSPAAWVEQDLEHCRILQGVTLLFSTDPADGYGVDFQVEVLSGDAVYFSRTVTGNRKTEVAVTGFTVHIPTMVRVRFLRWSLPSRRMRLPELVAGLYERWTGNDLSSFSATQQGAFSCLSLPYGAARVSMDNSDRRFEPRKKDSLFLSIEERQGVECWIGVKTGRVYEKVPIGIYYQYNYGWTSSSNGLTMEWNLVDIIGLLSQRTFLPPAKLPETLKGWIAALAAQLGPAFVKRFRVDPDYEDKPVAARDVADVTGKKCGDILRWVCQASGTWPRADAETGFLVAEPLWNQGNKVTLDNLNSYPGMKANESMAALIFQLAPLEEGAEKQEYVVSGNSTSSEKTVTIINPFLHTPDQALAAARLILAQCGGWTYETTGRGDPSSEIGDVDTLWLDESSAATARRMMQEFQYRSGVLQGCRSSLLQADGSYLWTEFEVIRTSGKWKAPPGVTQLRLVLGQGGQGGGAGQAGQWKPIGDSNISFSGYEPVPGEPGVDGAGGAIWYGVVDINPEQEFDVVLGAGGEPGEEYGKPGRMGGHTSFGPFTSEEGRYYETGYTDIANGQAFARPGVPAPLPGTGDGGAGGEGGEPGEGYLEWVPGDFSGGHNEWVVTKEPGPGGPGAKGGTGFAMVTWEKVENATKGEGNGRI